MNFQGQAPQFVVPMVQSGSGHQQISIPHESAIRMQMPMQPNMMYNQMQQFHPQHRHAHMPPHMRPPYFMQGPPPDDGSMFPANQYPPQQPYYPPVDHTRFNDTQYDGYPAPIGQNMFYNAPMQQPLIRPQGQMQQQPPPPPVVPHQMVASYIPPSRSNYPNANCPPNMSYGSRNETPATTTSRTDSKRSSPQDERANDGNSAPSPAAPIQNQMSGFTAPPPSSVQPLHPSATPPLNPKAAQFVSTQPVAQNYKPVKENSQSSGRWQEQRHDQQQDVRHDEPKRRDDQQKQYQSDRKFNDKETHDQNFAQSQKSEQFNAKNLTKTNTKKPFNAGRAGGQQYDDENGKTASSASKSSGRPRHERHQECCYCRSLNKPPNVYTSHNARDGENRVICKEFKKLVCGKCGATGENAHAEGLCNYQTNALAYVMEKLTPYFSQRYNYEPPRATAGYYHQSTYSNRRRQ
ncbi:hypothetical protein M3Y98_00587500 [Aphelenchoides besseyi]|nr:hypothetical protein M3Y98_00587500 [Aphelenchoides besseyi]KAI6193941.1 hypothetical protein M3Y96_01072000 [Aphelenchoides besseyi]